MNIDITKKTIAKNIKIEFIFKNFIFVIEAFFCEKYPNRTFAIGSITIPNDFPKKVATEYTDTDDGPNNG